MTTFLRYIALTLFAIGMSLNAMGDNKNGGHRMSREKFAETQASQFAKQLDLNESQTKQLITTYSAFQKEMWEIGPKREKPQTNEGKKEYTEEEARKELANRFAHWRKFNELQEKYYTEYSKFLTQVQILRLYDLERQQMDKMRNRSPKKPNRQHPKNAPARK